MPFLKRATDTTLLATGFSSAGWAARHNPKRHPPRAITIHMRRMTSSPYSQDAFDEDMTSKLIYWIADKKTAGGFPPCHQILIKKIEADFNETLDKGHLAESWRVALN